MKNHYLDDDQLDRTFGSLFKAAELSDAELEEIADAPDLFRSIREEIRAKQISREPKPFRLDWKNFTVGHWQHAAAFTTLLIALGLIGLFAREYVSSPSPVLEGSSSVPPLDVSQAADPNLTAEMPDAPARPAIGISVAPQTGKQKKSVVRTRSIPRQTRAESEEVGRFYTLPYAADFAKSDENGEIVRVQLPRSSLLAMGVEVQIENQNTDSIKADLLIGEDGLMKAVRIVDK